MEALSGSYNTEMRKGRADRRGVIEDKRTNCRLRAGATVSRERSAEVMGGKQRRAERNKTLTKN